MSIEVDRNLFIKNSAAYWDAIREGSSEAANKIERSTKALVKKWAEENIAIDNLSSMLGHSVPEVRFFAAAYLLEICINDEAIAVLEKISKEPVGLMPVSASTILRIRRPRPA